MTADFIVPATKTNISEYVSAIDTYSQVSVQSEGGNISIVLPRDKEVAASDWLEILEQLSCRLNAIDRTWPPNTPANLMARNRSIDTSQLQLLAEKLKQFSLDLKRVSTSRRQTAVAAASAGYSVEQEYPQESFAANPTERAAKLVEPLYLQTTLRSGTEIRHPGSIIIVGDLNPGSAAIAAGDIVVWGRLRGTAHAGAQGNRKGKIMALKMEPTQLRIADAIARAPEKLPEQFQPEVAYITPEGIRLKNAIDFAKHHTFSQKLRAWIDAPNQQLNK